MSERPAVTIVAHDVGSIGGMEGVLAELATGLSRIGHEVTVVARTCLLPEGSGVRFRRVRGPRRPVLVALPWFALAGSLALRGCRRGIVQSTGAIVLNRVDVIAVHYCHRVGPVSPSSRSILFRLHGHLTGYVKRSLERLCYRPRRARAFVCVSEAVAAEMREHFPAIAELVITINNGVDTDAFAPGLRADDAQQLRERLGIERGRLVAAFVARGLWEHKGLEQLLRALALSGRWDLLVAGDGHGARRRFQQLAASLGLAGATHWLGVTSDVQLVYAAADAFVLPSAYETFSLVSFEAAASGLPLLATPVGGLRELIDDGVSGFYVDRDPRQIAGRLDELAADPARRAAMGQAARHAALRFSWGETVARHSELYARLAGNASSQRMAHANL